MAYNRLGVRCAATGIVIQAMKDVAKLPYTDIGQDALDFLHSEWYEYLCDCSPALGLATDLKYIEHLLSITKKKYRRDFLESYLLQMKDYDKKTPRMKEWRQGKHEDG